MMTARQLLDRVLAPIVGETGDMLRARLRREIRADNFANLVPLILKARPNAPGTIVADATHLGPIENVIESEPFDARPAKVGAA